MQVYALISDVIRHPRGRIGSKPDHEEKNPVFSVSVRFFFAWHKDEYNISDNFATCFNTKKTH